MHTPNKKFERWALGFSGCDGGDIGSSANRSIWFCGIEWGGGFPSDKIKLQKIFDTDVSRPPAGYTKWEENLAYIFNRQASKLLTVINGGLFSDYEKFAKLSKPFVDGGSGYFKLNLYPLAFKNTSHSMWKESFAFSTGFPTKTDYIAWVKENMFRQLQKWTKTHQPKLIICAGKTYKDDFISAFVGPGHSVSKEKIEDKELYWAQNANGTVVAIIPFMVNRNGLTKNSQIQKFGDRIRNLGSHAA